MTALLRYLHFLLFKQKGSEGNEEARQQIRAIRGIRGPLGLSVEAEPRWLTARANGERWSAASTFITPTSARRWRAVKRPALTCPIFPLAGQETAPGLGVSASGLRPAARI